MQIKTVGPAQNTVDAMSLMTDHNIRHLPVIESGNFMGMLSIRDVVERVVKDAKVSRLRRRKAEAREGEEPMRARNAVL